MARRARRTDVAQLPATLSGLGLVREGLVREVTPDGVAGGERFQATRRLTLVR
jgi:hypothetical protein